jgi:hypothetical protein
MLLQEISYFNRQLFCFAYYDSSDSESDSEGDGVIRHSILTASIMLANSRNMYTERCDVVGAELSILRYYVMYYPYSQGSINRCKAIIMYDDVVDDAFIIHMAEILLHYYTQTASGASSFKSGY